MGKENNKIIYSGWIIISAIILAFCATANGKPNMESNVITWPAPSGEAASFDYELTVNGVPVFVHQARVRAKILEDKGLWPRPFSLTNHARTHPGYYC